MKLKVHEYEEALPVRLHTNYCWRDNKLVERLVVEAHNNGGWSYVALDAEELYNELKKYYERRSENELLG